jgi:hypothetical protein
MPLANRSKTAERKQALGKIRERQMKRSKKGRIDRFSGWKGFIQLRAGSSALRRVSHFAE